MRQRVNFQHEIWEMVADLYLPESFDKTKQYPAIVCVHPGGGVKEQTIGTYAL